jgi:hypothetical protein
MSKKKKGWRIEHERRVEKLLRAGVKISELDKVTIYEDRRTDHDVAVDLFYDAGKEMPMKPDFANMSQADRIRAIEHGGDGGAMTEEQMEGLDDYYDGDEFDEFDYLYEGKGKGKKEKKAVVFEYATADRNVPAQKTFTEFAFGDAEIPEEIYIKLVKAVQELGKDGLEVGGLLKIEVVDKKIKVLEYNLLPQEVGGADFEIKPEVMASWMMDHMLEPDFNKWRGWWHSHHKMGLFWSGTDDDQFDSLLVGNGQFKDTFGIVFTNDGNFRARYDVRTPFGISTVDEIEVDIVNAKEKVDEGKVEEEMKQLIKENVTEKKQTYLSYRYGTYDRWYDDKIELRDFIGYDDVYREVCFPWNMEDLETNVKMHKKTFKKWDLELECCVWGLEYERLMKAVQEFEEKKRKEAQKRKEEGKKEKEKKEKRGPGRPRKGEVTRSNINEDIQHLHK